MINYPFSISFLKAKEMKAQYIIIKLDEDNQSSFHLPSPTFTKFHP